MAVLGVGVVGGRLARELVSGRPELGVALHSSREDRRRSLTESFGSGVVVRSDTDDVDDSVEVVVLSGSQQRQPELAAQFLGAGRHVVCTADRPDVVEALLSLDGRAVDRGRSLVIGTVFSPGLSCLLARHAADSLDVVDEVHFARHGAAGPSCAADRLAALRSPVNEFFDGRWVPRSPGSGRELCWFPDPIGGADAYRAATGESMLAVEAFPSLVRSSTRLVQSRWDRVARRLPAPWPPPAEGGIGAVRVEVRGERAGERSTSVLGALDRPGVVAAGVSAEVVRDLLEGTAPLGAHGLAAWSNAGDLLSRLRVRGIRVAVLEGG